MKARRCGGLRQSTGGFFRPRHLPGAAAALGLGLASVTMAAAEAGRIQACPATPNCVSSSSRSDSHYVRAFSFEGDPDAAWARLKQAVQGEPGLAVVEDSSVDRYLRLKATSRVFRFVDDVEFQLLPASKMIAVRSASRVGYWDFGVNGRRVERLRERFNASGEAR
ncbi:DUF1499 domain-containing protein [Methylotetracoccus oryzae]|uniref:DUF1499 domain-containing protein n=1 Tax=Methylotetracoccus oryzae TaxID=1919059 RepID=UPI00111BA120|nr:DUF1499 domain-containing protein [Methylotetracoccus oryzae]